MKLFNPSTGGPLERPQALSSIEIEQRVGRSHAAFAEFRQSTFEQRAKGVLRLKDLLHAHREELALEMTNEMGKLTRESLAEVDKCVASCRTIVQLFPVWRKEHEQVLAGGYQITREPLGVLLGIMPWNFPAWQVIRFAVPALLCGNTILLKHAQITWRSARLIESLFLQAFELPVYLDLRAEHSVIEELIGDPRIRGVSLTGSRGAGSKIGALAGQHLKKCVLELGGSDAYLILADADLELAAKSCVQSRLINAGQSCVSAKRFIVLREQADAFTASFIQEMKLAKMGAPTDSSTSVAPMARADLRDQLQEQVAASVKLGARIAYQAVDLPPNGFYFPPTVLTHVRPGMPAFDDELFGPVAAIVVAADEREAIALANQSIYGLGAAVFSRNIDRAQKLASASIDAGMVFINDFVKSDPVAPFGGVKDSGLGRELGREGCFEFTNIKSVFTPSH